MCAHHKVVWAREPTHEVQWVAPGAEGTVDPKVEVRESLGRRVARRAAAPLGGGGVTVYGRRRAQRGREWPEDLGVVAVLKLPCKDPIKGEAAACVAVHKPGLARTSRSTRVERGAAIEEESAWRRWAHLGKPGGQHVVLAERRAAALDAVVMRVAQRPNQRLDGYDCRLSTAAINHAMRGDKGVAQPLHCLAVRCRGRIHGRVPASPLKSPQPARVSRSACSRSQAAIGWVWLATTCSIVQGPSQNAAQPFGCQRPRTSPICAAHHCSQPLAW
mmetsp:Transcript_48004/g.155712  ORF Transcript_48004/g.155712 Transcript_48004/m.155712 type:complete len:274 (-) Transcript_48004:1831-2652(-)